MAIADGSTRGAGAGGAGRIGAEGERPTPADRPPLKRLPDHASIEQTIFAYNEAVHAYTRLAADNGTLAAACYAHMSKQDNEVELIRAEVVVLGAGVRDALDAMRDIRDRVIAIEEKLSSNIRQPAAISSIRRASDLASIPPTRPPGDSSHDLSKAAGAVVAERIDAEARNPTTPQPTPEVIAKIAEDTFQTIITQVKA